ncbi:UDP-N-acetylmuramoyl-L-alanyl-D-glutamate--2,6-diaminopimelate ligase [Trichlorobacter lovleyi]|uniref:UDP-N-acetylmuramoyl-L-alanyl-D-glutamate--2, 6-diaminopimelate ligase n=1 Tax=Trichlorobacter lovleyi TaxID=313985 RepID=UPI0024810651|nr:UDP-N-acetylmuramoyl-L-alanyl-D-glutamate--2,6-diaminopimelate ligase [Trichlorobacter lovleyi]
MLLEQLLHEVPLQATHGNLDVTVSALTCDSREVTAGTLFFALHGSKVDGHRFISQAVAAGAAAVVLEDVSYAPEQVPWLQVTNGRQAMALMAARFFGNPTRDLPLIGITGTNGKTTTSYLLEGILTAAGLPPAVLGTISYRFGTTCIEASHTTPESTELQGIFRQLADAGAQAFVMEVSSHSLEQRRVDGSVFDIGVFTNLTRDHLDYHGTMQAYGSAKQRLFSELLRPDDRTPLRHAVINADDPAAEEFIRAAACPVIRYGLAPGSEVTVRETTSSVNGISAILVTPQGEQPFHSRLLGGFNLSNILAAAAAGVALGLPLQAIIQGIEQHTTVPGRLERVENRAGVTCLVDYAHTGDALENVLSTLKDLAGARIITVFGCGGDRDNGKRPIMGRIAAGYSDLAVVTSDNPRTEDPHEILRQIRAGILPLGLREYRPDELTAPPEDKGFVMLENRREAIRLAVRLARPGDILLLAGKGHEDYQIIGQTKQHFDDREEAANAFRERI